MRHEGFVRADGPEFGWDCRCGDNATGFPTQTTAEDSLRHHLALVPDDRSSADRLQAFADLYHPASYAGLLLRRAVRIARGVEPVPTAQELADEEKTAAAIPVRLNEPTHHQ